MGVRYTNKVCIMRANIRVILCRRRSKGVWNTLPSYPREYAVYALIYESPTLSQITGCIILFLFMRIDASVYGSHDGVNHIAKRVWRASRRHLSYPMTEENSECTDESSTMLITGSGSGRTGSSTCSPRCCFIKLVMNTRISSRLAVKACA